MGILCRLKYRRNVGITQAIAKKKGLSEDEYSDLCDKLKKRALLLFLRGL